MFLKTEQRTRILPSRRLFRFFFRFRSFPKMELFSKPETQVLLCCSNSGELVNFPISLLSLRNGALASAFRIFPSNSIFSFQSILYSKHRASALNLLTVYRVYAAMHYFQSFQHERLPLVTMGQRLWTGYKGRARARRQLESGHRQIQFDTRSFELCALNIL